MPICARRSFQYGEKGATTSRTCSRTKRSRSVAWAEELRRSHEGIGREPNDPDSALALLDFLGQLRHDVEKVTDDTEVDELEDRRLGILVDRNDRLRRLHAGAVLDRTGDARRDVELRRHRLAGLPDLVLVRVPAGVGRGTRRTDGR